MVASGAWRNGAGCVLATTTEGSSCKRGVSFRIGSDDTRPENGLNLHSRSNRTHQAVEGVLTCGGETTRIPTHPSSLACPFLLPCLFPRPPFRFLCAGRCLCLAPPPLRCFPFFPMTIGCGCGSDKFVTTHPTTQLVWIVTSCCKNPTERPLSTPPCTALL